MKVFLLAYNEIFLLPQVHQWWKEGFPQAELVLIDNHSTDGTPETAHALGWTVKQFQTDGMADAVHIQLKNTIWKGCEHDWVWVADFDELPGFGQAELDALDENISVVRLKGYDFFDTAYTIQEARYAVQLDGYSKCCLFRPTKVEEIAYNVGAHECSPILKEGIIAEKILDLYHMKWFSPTHALARAQVYAERQSWDNIERAWSYHYSLPVEKHLEYYTMMYNQRVKVR